MHFDRIIILHFLPYSIQASSLPFVPCQHWDFHWNFEHFHISQQKLFSAFIWHLAFAAQKNSQREIKSIWIMIFMLCSVVVIQSHSPPYFFHLNGIPTQLIAFFPHINFFFLLCSVATNRNHLDIVLAIYEYSKANLVKKEKFILSTCNLQKNF